MKKSYTISIPVKRFWTVILPLAFLLMIVGGIVGILLVDRYVMPNITGVSNRGVVKVPTIVDMRWEEGRQALYNVGLRLQVQSYEYNDSLENGVIISQRPQPEEKVKKGRHVFVIVSKGREVDTIPDVRNMTERIGKKVLRKAGFRNVKVCKAYSEHYDKDVIVSTKPGRGTVISREIPVEITLSKGPRPTHAVVPNVIGERLSEAKQALEENGLFVGKIEYKVNPTAQPGSVISQSISPGKNAPLESRVNLIVSASM